MGQLLDIYIYVLYLLFDCVCYVRRRRTLVHLSVS